MVLTGNYYLQFKLNEMRNAMFWVEIPAKNFDRAKKFYETVFELEITLVPIPRGQYGIFPLDAKAMGAGWAKSPFHHPL